MRGKPCGHSLELKFKVVCGQISPTKKKKKTPTGYLKGYSGSKCHGYLPPSNIFSRCMPTPFGVNGKFSERLLEGATAKKASRKSRVSVLFRFKIYEG